MIPTYGINTRQIKRYKYSHLPKVALTLNQLLRPLVVLVSNAKSSDTLRPLLGRKLIPATSKFNSIECVVLDREIKSDLYSFNILVALAGLSTASCIYGSLNLQY